VALEVVRSISALTSAPTNRASLASYICLPWNSTEDYGSAHMNQQLYYRLCEAAPTREGGNATALDNALRKFEDGKCPFSEQNAVSIGQRAGLQTRPQLRMVLLNDGVPGHVGGIQEILDMEMEQYVGWCPSIMSRLKG
jgi:hypothetical protein